MKSYCVILLIILIMFSGCNSQSRHGIEEEDEFYTIDFEKSFNIEQQMLMSEIADSVEYIELKTPQDIIIANIPDIKTFDGNLILKSGGIVYLFNMNGHFLKQIGNRGQGPGEYYFAYDVEIDTKRREIIVSGGEQLLFYNLEGHFLRTLKLNGFINNMDILDSILWISNLIYKANIKHYAVAFSLNNMFINNESDTIAYIPNPHFSENVAGGGFEGTNLSEEFYHNRNLLYFKGEMFNNDIWRISGTNIEPHATINLGKYKMPTEYEAWYSSSDIYRQHSERYWCVSSLVEDDNYFYLLSENRKFTKIDRKLKYIVYDKKKKKGFAVNDGDGIGLTDDIQGGPPLWPRWISEDYYINTIEAHELLEKIKTGDYSPSSKLNDLISRIGEDTNQLIILCRKKKNL